MSTFIRRSTLLIAALLLSALAAHSQVVGGTIDGVVTDPTGAIVQHTQVVVRNEETGTHRTLLTGDDGRFAAISIPAGRYTLTAEAPGFANYKLINLPLTVGQSINLHVNLQVSGNDTIDVSSQPLGVNLSTEETSGVVDARQVKDLPLNGRSYDQLLTLNPASVNYTGQRSGTVGTSNSSVGNMFAISGRRPQDNLYLLNGIEYTGASLINVTPGGTSGQLLGVDGIREFNVMSDSYSAAYGKRDGAQISIVTASGTNHIHGAAYEYLRNSFFDARNYFDQSRIPEFQRNNFGASLGGPIRTNRLFLFGNYEGYRQNLGLSNAALVPDATSRAAAAPSVKPLLNLWPIANGPELTDANGKPTGIAYAYSSPEQRIREDFGTTRFDDNITASDLLFAVYTVDDSTAHTPTQNPYSLIDEKPPRTSRQHSGATRLLSEAPQHRALRLLARQLLLSRLAARGYPGHHLNLRPRQAHRRRRHRRFHRIQRQLADHRRRRQRRLQQRHHTQPLHLRRPRLLDRRPPSARARRLAATPAIQRQPRTEPVRPGLLRLATNLPRRQH
jgi:hypothetical protein